MGGYYDLIAGVAQQATHFARGVVVVHVEIATFTTRRTAADGAAPLLLAEDRVVVIAAEAVDGLCAAPPAWESLGRVQFALGMSAVISDDSDGILRSTRGTAELRLRIGRIDGPEDRIATAATGLGGYRGWLALSVETDMDGHGPGVHVSHGLSGLFSSLFEVRDDVLAVHG